MIVNLIPAEQTYALRRSVLRKNDPNADMVWDGDLVDGTFHIGATVDGNYSNDGEIVGVATLIPHGNPKLADMNAQIPYRLRGMAVDPNYQRQGIGRAIVQYAIDAVRANGCDLLWFNARETAVPFYEKCGFVTVGEPFETIGIAVHYVMVQPFTP